MTAGDVGGTARLGARDTRNDGAYPPRVLVTGANGFVGRYLAGRLASAGSAVRGAVRRAAATTSLPAGVEALVVDAPGEAGAWAPAVDGMDVVVHLVGLAHQEVHDPDPRRAYRAVNVDITRAVLTASATAGVRRLVYLSSIKAVGEGAPAAYTEANRCQPEDAYGWSKREAELVVLAAPEPLETVVVRSPMVYGPGVKGNFLRLLHALDRGLPLPLARVTGRRSMVFVGNLADAIVTLLHAPDVGGEVFHVADDEPWSLPDLLRRLGWLLGRPARLLPVPVPVLLLGAQVLGRREEIRRLTGTLLVSTSKLRERVGWAPPFTNQAGLEATAAWFSSTAPEAVSPAGRVPGWPGRSSSRSGSPSG